VVPAARVNKPDFLTEISKETAYIGRENLRSCRYNNVGPMCQGNFVLNAFNAEETLQREPVEMVN